jgi:hypothetical protein
LERRRVRPAPFARVGLERRREPAQDQRPDLRDLVDVPAAPEARLLDHGVTVVTSHSDDERLVGSRHATSICPAGKRPANAAGDRRM